MISELEDIAATRDSCEQQELMTAHKTSPEVYTQLLTIYLIDNDVVNAKFLWKRIPEQLKSGELENIWKIGQFLWKRDFVNVYVAVSNEWSPLIKPLIKTLVETLRQRMILLISEAYSVIKIDDLCKLVGLDESETVELVLSKSWEIDMDNKVVKPSKIEKDAEYYKESGMCDKLMQSLTDYVSFLEN